MSNGFDISLVVLYTLLVLTSLPINILCFIVLRKVRDITDTTKLLLKSLTLADILFCFFRSVPAIGAAVNNSWPFGNFLCQSLPVPRDTAYYASLLSLLAVNVDRCIAVVFPLRYPLWITYRRAQICVFAIWITSLGILLAAGLANWHSAYVKFVHACWLNFFATETLIMTLIWYWFPAIILSIIVICFVAVMVTSHRALKTCPSSTIISGGNNHDRQHMNTKAAVTLFLLSLSLLLANLPWIIVRLTNTQGYALSFSTFMCVSGGLWNVLVYYFRNRMFRNEINALLFRRRQWQPREESVFHL